MKVKDFLREKNVEFEVLPHEPTYDAQHMAHAVHVPGKCVAKTVMLRTSGGFKYVLAILPATHRIDMERLSKQFGGEKFEFANRNTMCVQCPDWEPGVLPPFGSRYWMETIVDPALCESEHIVFEGNTHEESIRMKYSDFEAIEHPRVVSFAVPAATARPNPAGE